MLPSPAWLLTRCQCGAVRRGRAFSLRLDDRCGCSHPIDRMRATDPKFGPALVPQPSAQARRQRIADRTRGRTNHASNPLKRLPLSSAARRRRNHRPPARACQPETEFLYPTGIRCGMRARRGPIRIRAVAPSPGRQSCSSCALRRPPVCLTSWTCCSWPLLHHAEGGNSKSSRGAPAGVNLRSPQRL